MLFIFFLFSLSDCARKKKNTKSKANTETPTSAIIAASSFSVVFVVLVTMFLLWLFAPKCCYTCCPCFTRCFCWSGKRETEEEEEEEKDENGVVLPKTTVKLFNKDSENHGEYYLPPNSTVLNQNLPIPNDNICDSSLKYGYPANNMNDSIPQYVQTNYNPSNQDQSIIYPNPYD